MKFAFDRPIRCGYQTGRRIFHQLAPRMGEQIFPNYNARPNYIRVSKRLCTIEVMLVKVKPEYYGKPVFGSRQQALTAIRKML